MNKSSRVFPDDDDKVFEWVVWSIIGRLTASLLHEINNPMQSIRGAAALGLEELEDPESLQAYFQVILNESERVSDAIARARRIYRPERQTLERLDMNHLLQEAVLLLQKLLDQHRVQVQTDYAPELPLLTAVFSHISLVILYPLLDLITSVNATMGGELFLQTKADAGGIAVRLQIKAAEFCLTPPLLLPYADLAARYNIRLNEQSVATGHVIHFLFSTPSK